MELILKIEKTDIVTTKYGNNYAINLKDLTIIFSPEAVDEFINDINDIKLDDLKNTIDD